jgi:putative effector of murein hydrolase
MNPLLVGITLIISLIAFTPYTYDYYKNGGAYIAFFILPATVVLAVNVYRERAVMTANLLPLIAGCAAGSVTSIACIYAAGRLFKLDSALVNSMLPKSVTTAVALELSARRGGISGITILAITITGIGASLICPPLIKGLGLKDRVACGCAMGMAGHAIGTARAAGLGELEGGMSGIALCCAAIITSVLFAFL